ncbi:hypothetical protein GCM10022245_54530 [Streptomyces mayteni]
MARAGGQDPWATQTRFNGEINLPHMARAGDALLEAADGARDVKDLATRADAISEPAGAVNGAPLAVSSERFDETRVNIRDERLDQAVEYNFRAMRRASDTLNQVNAAITPNGLDARIGNYQAEALQDWNYWETTRQGIQQQYQNNPTATLPTIVYKQNSVTFGRLPDGTVTLPPELPTNIRDTYLQGAGDDARGTGGSIDAQIAMYRHALTEMAADLGEWGYNVASGPVDIFATPEMARFTAERINAEMAKDNPDELYLELYTENLQSITGGVFGDPLAPGQVAQRGLTPQESTYLQAFYNTLSPEALAKLGSMEDLSGFAKTNVANGIDMLMNPDIGGIDVSGTGGAQQVPDSIAEYLYGYDQRITEPGGVEAFNGFGRLMESSALTPGDDFARTTGIASLGVQEAIDRRNFVPSEPLTGSSDLLSHASRNADASLDLLSQQSTRERFLAVDWQDSQGIADVIRSATYPGAEGLTVEQKSVADGVLTFYTDNPEELVPDWSTDGPPPDFPPDVVPLQGAVADTALRRMDDIAGYGANPYAERDRYGTFSLMAAADPTVNEYFKTGVNAVQYGLAYERYADGGADAFTTMNRIGTLNQLVSWGEQDVINHYQGREDKENELRRDLATASAGAILGVAGMAPGPLGVGMSLTEQGWSVAESAFPEFEPQAPRALGDYQLEGAFLNDERMRYTVLSALAAAHNEGAPLDRIDMPPASTVTERFDIAGSVANPALDDVEERLGGDVSRDIAAAMGSRHVPEFNPDDRATAERRLDPSEQAEEQPR